jgi:serine/threonine-protein kinase
MTPERWQIVKRVFECVVQQQPGERTAYLDRSCAGDPLLRADVEAMLASDKCAGTFIETLSVDLVPELVAGTRAITPRPTQIGAYRVLSLVGTGGMGEVYLAEDSRLGRKVALKVLTPEFGTNGASQRRFVREAQLASALDHPNICTIYEVGAADGLLFISMQYVEGDTLQHVLSGGALSVQRLLSIALQVADALGAAHAHAIVHRDIKPSNIMLTPRGQAKVLDFGIAKSLAPTAGSVGGSHLTRTGGVFGTPCYLSPEQARGQSVDHRSDIFSFGVVLYEMATGRPPFSEESAAETMNAVINEPHPPLSGSQPQIPSALVTIVNRALTKDRAQRYQSMGEIGAELRYVAQAIGLVRSQDAETALDTSFLRSSTVDESKARRTLPRKSLPRSSGAVGLALCAMVLVAAITAGVLGLRDAADSIRSVAVLPFAHEGSPAELEYLADGIGESVTARLSQLPRLRVMARSTMSTYKNRSVDPRAVGRELKVEAVLTGQVIQEGETVIIRIELVDVAAGERIWGEQYRRPVSQVFALPADLAAAVSEEMRPRLTGEPKSRVTKYHTQNADAYRHYIKGRYFLNKRTDEGSRTAIGYFMQAVEKDPVYALAYAGLADAYLVRRGYGFSPPDETIPRARAAAEQALRLDESLAEAHTSLAWIKTLSFQWSDADATYKRAIELNPNYATMYHWYALHQATVGRLDDALATIRRAQELDPLSLIINTELGRILYFMRRYDEAIAQYRKTLEMDPAFAPAHLHLGAIYEQKGMYADALGEYQKALALGLQQLATARIGRVYARSGRRREAEAVLMRLSELSKDHFVPYNALFSLCASLGRDDEALVWLEKVFLTGAAPWFLKVDPDYDSVRSNPKFRELLRQSGLEP